MLSQAYPYTTGNSAATDSADAFQLSMYMATDNVHIPTPPPPPGVWLHAYYNGWEVALNDLYILGQTDPNDPTTNYEPVVVANSDTVSRTYDITADAAWLGIDTPTVTLDANAQTDITLSATCPAGGGTVLQTTVRVFVGGLQVWDFPYTLDCSRERSAYYAQPSRPQA